MRFTGLVSRCNPAYIYTHRGIVPALIDTDEVQPPGRNKRLLAVEKDKPGGSEAVVASE